MEILKEINTKPTQQKQICHTLQKLTILPEPWPKSSQKFTDFYPSSSAPGLNPKLITVRQKNGNIRIRVGLC